MFKLNVEVATYYKKLSCRREAARCFVFVVRFNIPTAQLFITSYCGFKFTIA